MEKQRPDGKVLLVVNDVGEVNVDATRLGHLGEMEALTAGCIGCADLPAFLRVMEQATAAGVDHLIIEPTGIADGREIRDVTARAGIPMSSVTLIDVEHFKRNRALGVMETQLGVAGMVGLTWCDALLDHPDGVVQPALEEIVAFCGTHAPGKAVSLVSSQPANFVALVVERYLVGELRVDESAKPSPCSGPGADGAHAGGHHHRDHDHHHDHSHGHHHSGHHNHGAYAESGALPEVFTKATLTALIVEMGDTLVRAKGVVEGASFDFTMGTLQFGAASSAEPHATFISTSPLGIIERHAMVEGTKKQLMRGYAAPLEATLAALQWQLGEYPSNRAPSGEIRVDCEADIIRQLCERKGVPAERRAEALQQYVGWRLQSLRLLVGDGDRWHDQADLPYWRRRLGGVLCWHAENVGSALHEAQIAEMVRLDAPRHALEGLLGLTELGFDQELAEERPELIADCIRFAHQHDILDQDLVKRALTHCLALSGSNTDWHGRWRTVTAQFLETA